MSFDEVIRVLMSIAHEWELEPDVGRTATSGDSYTRAQRMHFRLCECSNNDQGYDGVDYVAAGPQGGILYVGLNLNTGEITCGPKGYHSSYYRNNAPCV
jgi:hypothetical protein